MTYVRRVAADRELMDRDTGIRGKSASAELAYVTVTGRRTQVIAAKKWWSLDDTMGYGSSPLLHRCMREYSWDKEYAVKVLKAYRQFLELKKVLEDWDAEIIAPSLPVDQMWHQHIRDVTNYCHDCMLLCGRVIGNDPDSSLDQWKLSKRVLATKQLLRARYESHIDDDVWDFSNTRHEMNVVEPAPTWLREQGYIEQLETRNPGIAMSGVILEEHRVNGNCIKAKSAESMEYGIARAQSIESGNGREDSSSTMKEVPNDTSVGVGIANGADDRNADFLIRVRTLKGQVFSLKVKSGTTIYQVKSQIHQLCGTPEEQQHLLFYGKVLEDWKTMIEHGIPPNAGLQILARSGGSPTVGISSEI
jgi:hypothetical protein